MSLAKNDFPDPGGPLRMRTILGGLILLPGYSIRSVSSVGSGTVIKSFRVGLFRSIARELKRQKKTF